VYNRYCFINKGLLIMFRQIGAFLVFILSFIVDCLPSVLLDKASMLFEVTRTSIFKFRQKSSKLMLIIKSFFNLSAVVAGQSKYKLAVNVNG